jgi:hypothetical protein
MQVSSFDFLGTAVARIERLMEEAVVMAVDKDSTQRGLGLTILILIRPDVSWNHSSENMETV